MLVAADHGTVDICLDVVVNETNIFVSNCELKVFLSGFLPLNAHDLLDSISDIYLFEVLFELTSFDCSVVNTILDNVVHQLSRNLLDFLSINQFFQDLQALLEPRRFFGGLITRLQKISYFLIES